MKQGNYADGCLPKFFKVYLTDDSGDDLEIPISFNSCLPKSLPKDVTVRSIYGNVWKTALRKFSSGDVEKFVIVNGWKRITKEENLECGDFLEFEFDGSRCFNFCIYKRRTMCKRRRRSSVQSYEVKVETDEEEEAIASDDDSDDADYDSADDNDSDDDDDQKQYLDDRKNPSFTATLNPKRKSQLRIPAQVIEDYGLNFPKSITVVDPLVTEYGRVEKKIKMQKNGCVFVKGFGSIIRRNNVSITDKMIFELKKKGSNNLVHTMKVYVVSG